MEALTVLSVVFGGLDKYTIWIFKSFDAWIKRRAQDRIVLKHNKGMIYQLLALSIYPGSPHTLRAWMQGYCKFQSLTA